MSSSVGATEIIRNLSPRQQKEVIDDAMKLLNRLGNIARLLCPECRKLIKENVTDISGTSCL